MNTTTRAEEIDPLLAKSRKRIQKQLAVDSDAAADEAWSNPENIKKLGLDELTAHRIAKQAMTGLLPETPGDITDFSQIISKDEQDQIEALESDTISEAGRSVLPEGYKPRGIKINPITREQFKIELNGNKQKPTKSAPLYDQERDETAA